jgi:hypothetical protein
VSILGFVVSKTGDYVGDVRVAKAALDVYNPDYRISDSPQNATSWKVTYRSPVTAAGALDLGHLEAGVHDVPFVFRQSGGGDFAIRVRLSHAASEHPVAGRAASAPLAPPISPTATPAGTRVMVDGRAGKRAVTLGVRRAGAIARSALSARLAGWRSTLLRCDVQSAQSPQSAHCRFIAGHDRSVLEGQAIVTLPFGGARPRYRLAATVTQGGCRRRCVARPPQRAF